jgi:hypothetical protein
VKQMAVHVPQLPVQKVGTPHLDTSVHSGGFAI